MPWRQSTSVPKQSNVSHRGGTIDSAPGGPVTDRLLAGRVDLLWSHAHSRLDAVQRACGCDGHRKSGSGGVVYAVDDPKDIRVTKCQVEGFDLSAERFDRGLDGGAASGASLLQHTFDSLCRVGTLKQISRHRASPPSITDRQFSASLRQVLLDRVRQVLHAHRLQPDATRPRQRGEEEATAAEERVLDSGHSRDVELHRFLVHADVAGVHAQGVARLQVVGHHLAVQLDPRLALSLETLHPESRAPDNARAQPLLEADRKLDPDRGAHETAPLYHVALSWGDIPVQELSA